MEATTPKQSRKLLRTSQAITCAVLVAFAAHTGFGIGGRGLNSFFNDWVYNGLVLVAAISCLLRAVRLRERRAGWLVLGMGLASWSTGEIYNTVHLAHLQTPPYPSLSDLLQLLFYPASCVALLLLARGRVRHARASLWLDGIVAALAVCMVGEVTVFHTVVAAGDKSETPLQMATDLAYPIGDMAIMALVASVFALTAWRPGRAWTMIGAGLGLAAVADSIFAYQNAAGTYTIGTALDALWPAAALLIGFAAWERSGARQEARLEGWRILVVPVAFALPALGFLVYDHYEHIDGAATALAGMTLVTVIVRTAMTFGENMRMLRRSRHEALTDALTGLGNRRSLMHDLEVALAGPRAGTPRALILFDLDGFKRYNDDFGHPAGDALLSQFGANLIGAVAPDGRAYRLGGDEFCALVSTDAPGAGRVVAAATAALSAHGSGFVVTASHGLVLMPDEAREPTAALQIADQRLYGNKNRRQATVVSQQTRDVLMQVLQEQQPELHEHLHEVSWLTLTVGRRMSVDVQDLSEMVRAAELHDVGKMAVPDQILGKPGPLDDIEQDFIRQHTIVGERILAAAPALQSVARLVRSTHENWDGSGYPDGLAGEEIPLGARIIAACDAYHAMTSDRPYQAALRPEQAVAELRRCAGTKFDPRVVEVLSAEIEAGRALAPEGDNELEFPTITAPGAETRADHLIDPG